MEALIVEEELREWSRGRTDMGGSEMKRRARIVAELAVAWVLAVTVSAMPRAIPDAGPNGSAQSAGGQMAAPVKTPPAVGTIKSIGEGTIVLVNEAGAEIKVTIGAEVKYLRVAAGSKDLKEAVAISVGDLAVGDRVLVRGKAGEEAGTFVATTVISMKKEDLAAKQAREREEWQRKGIGGLVKGVDAAAGVVTVGTMTAAGKKDVEVHVGAATIVRRYAPGSVKFDDAKASSLAEIRAGDQLRARGTKSEDGGSLTADEIVAGSFRNIAGTVVAVDAAGGTITVTDLGNGKAVEVKITAESQVKKLPLAMAQRIAMRLKGTAEGAAAGNGTASGAAAGGGANGAAASGARGPGGQGGMGGGNGGGGGDLQAMLGRMPASALSEFAKGDAVVIVATSGASEAKVVAITMLGGVEPILQTSTQGQAASILSPWSLSNGGGDAGTP